MGVPPAHTLPMTLPPPPRSISKRPKTLGELIARMVLGGMKFIGVIWVLIILAPWLTLIVGQPITAISDGKTETAHTNGTYSYALQFHYDDQGQTIHDSQPMTVAEYTSATAPGSTLDARAVSILGYHSALTGEAGPKPKRMSLILGIGWIVITFAISSIAARDRRIWARLARHGIAVDGQIIGRGKSPRGVTYFLTYEYVAPEGKRFENTYGVTRGPYEQFPLGASITVLYEKSRPARGWPYELGIYDIVS